MDKALCACKDDLTIHKFVTKNETGEEGALCMSCLKFKPLDSEGMFDVMEHYREMSGKTSPLR